MLEIENLLQKFVLTDNLKAMANNDISTNIQSNNSPQDIVAMYLQKMSVQEGVNGLIFKEGPRRGFSSKPQLLGNIEFKNDFIKLLRQQPFDCGTLKNPSLPFIASDSSKAREIFMKFGAIHIGNDKTDNEVELGVHQTRGCMAFVVKQRVAFAIVDNNEQITFKRAESLRLFTWTSQWSGRTETVVARSLPDMEHFYSIKVEENLRSNTKEAKVDPQVKDLIIVSLGLNPDWYFDRHLYALGKALRKTDLYDVKYYLSGVYKYITEEGTLEVMMRDQTEYFNHFNSRKGLENVEYVQDLAKTFVPATHISQFAFILSGIGEVDLQNLQIDSEMTLPLQIEGNGHRSAQLLRAKHSKGIKVMMLAGKVMHELCVKEVKEKIVELNENR